jgi:hypothetical protein
MVQRRRTWSDARAPSVRSATFGAVPASARDRHPHACVCIVLPSRLPLLDQQPPAGKVTQRCAGCIQVSDRARGGIRALIASSPVVHRGTIRSRRRANAPGRYAPRHDVVCVRIALTVPWLIASTAGRSPIVSAGKRTVRRVAPAGGSRQTTMPTVASPSPVHVGGEPGPPVSDSAACHPPERHRRRTVRTVCVQHLTASAPSWAVRYWPWLRSVSSRIRALRWGRAGALLV